MVSIEFALASRFVVVIGSRWHAFLYDALDSQSDQNYQVLDQRGLQDPARRSLFQTHARSGSVNGHSRTASQVSRHLYTFSGSATARASAGSRAQVLTVVGSQC